MSKIEDPRVRVSILFNTLNDDEKTASHFWKNLNSEVRKDILVSVAKYFEGMTLNQIMESAAKVKSYRASPVIESILNQNSGLESEVQDVPENLPLEIKTNQGDVKSKTVKDENLDSGFKMKSRRDMRKKK